MSEMNLDVLARHKLVIENALKCLRLIPDDENALRSQIASEFERLLPVFVKSVVLVAMLPSIQVAARAHFCRAKMDFFDAEDLSMDVVQKIWKSLFGGVPFGNEGAWVAEIRANAHRDHIRKSRKTERVGGRCDVAEIAQTDDDRRAEWNLFVDELPSEQRRIVERLREGDTWEEIAVTLQKSVAEVVKVFYEIEWPEGFSPPSPKRRPRKRSS